MTYYIKSDEGIYVGYQNKIYKTQYLDEPQFEETIYIRDSYLKLEDENIETLYYNGLEVYVFHYIYEINQTISFGISYMNDDNEFFIGDVMKFYQYIDGETLEYECETEIQIQYDYNGVEYYLWYSVDWANSDPINHVFAFTKC